MHACVDPVTTRELKFSICILEYDSLTMRKKLDAVLWSE